jgi:hypothetical protein
VALRHLGVAVAGQIHHAKGSVDFKKIDELCATGRLRHTGEPLFSSEESKGSSKGSGINY